MANTMDLYRMMWMGTYMPCHDHTPPVSHPIATVSVRETDYWIEVGVHDKAGGFSVMNNAVNLP